MIEKIKARGEELKTLEGHDRLQYLVDIAREVKPLADDEKIDDNKQTRRRRLYHKRYSEDNHRHSKRRKCRRSSTTYTRRF